MDTRKQGVARRLILSLAAASALSACVYDPYYPYYGSPYGTVRSYDATPAPAVTDGASTGTSTIATTIVPTPPYYPYRPYPYYYPYPYAYPTYVGPPISFSFGYYHHSGHGWGHHGGHGHGWGGHGWGGHGGHHGGGHGRH